MKYKLTVKGMSCTHCEQRVKELITDLKLEELTISYKTGLLSYKYKTEQTKQIQNRLKESEYSVGLYKEQKWKTYGIYALFIIMFLSVSRIVYNQFDVITFEDTVPMVSVLLFGLVTSLHCVGMCGGIALSQTDFITPKKNLMNTLQYNLGRIFTYSMIGALLGLLGKTLSISDDIKSLMFFVIGAVMLLLGLNNLGIIKFRIKQLGFQPPKSLKGRGPLVVGLMNGFMPCGPLQTMQLLAITTASALNGFLVMLLFGIGTMPLLYLFSNLGLLIKKSHQKHITRISAIVVILMSIMIFQQGFSSLGVSTVVAKTDEQSFAIIEDGYQIVNLYVDPYYTTEDVKVKKDLPVKLLIHVEKVSGCTANIMVPKYDVNTDLSIGETYELIFTPTVPENLKITCWMSMVNTYLNVVE